MQKYKKMTSVLYIDVFFVGNVTAFLKKKSPHQRHAALQDDVTGG